MRLNETKDEPQRTQRVAEERQGLKKQTADLRFLNSNSYFFLSSAILCVLCGEKSLSLSHASATSYKIVWITVENRRRFLIVNELN
jgi:hypothetical protein